MPCSTFGRKLAATYGCAFIDADEYHPAANVGELQLSFLCGPSFMHSLETFIQRHDTTKAPGT